jgi:hypothetical protein
VVRGAKTDVVARVAGCAALPGPRRTHGVGLEFTHISEAARESLRAVLGSIREGHDLGRGQEKRRPRPPG